MNDKIPKKIYQSWKTKDIQGNMLQAVNRVKALNPDYEYYLYDDQDCRDFLLNNFGKEYLMAFDNLIPGAFKCDFWRYAILYLYGGVYVDIDLTPLVPFNQMIDPEDEFVSVVDKDTWGGQNAIYQAFIACAPKHPILKHALKLCFYNIITKRETNYIENGFNLTGPTMFGQSINIFWNKDSDTLIRPGKYGDINLNYQLDNSGEYITRDTDKQRVFKNKYEGYSRGEFNYADKTIPKYKNSKSYSNKDTIIFLLYCITTIILLALISVVIYKLKYEKCKSVCSRI